MSNAKITAIGEEWIAALRNISTLDAHQNRIASLPSNLNELPLRELFLGRNQFVSEEIERLICSYPGSTLVKNLLDLDLSPVVSSICRR